MRRAVLLHPQICILRSSTQLNYQRVCSLTWRARMSQGEVRAALRAARAALQESQWKEVLQHCKVALKADRQCYDAYV